MGKLCPICGEWSAVKQNITVDGKGATKANDVIAQVLACGHTVGGEEYEEFVAQCREIDVATVTKVRSLQKTNASKKAALWKALSNETPEGE